MALEELGPIFTDKLGTKTAQRFLNLADGNFVDDVTDDIKCFLHAKKLANVLVFPPVSNYRRFLIHNSVQELSAGLLSTFSVGVGDERRTVVCFKEQLLSDVASASAAMGLSQADRNEVSLSCAGAAVGECKRPSPAQPRETARSSKPKRPDRAVYVPRALRDSAATGDSPSAQTPTDNRKRSKPIVAAPSAKCPKTPRDKSLPGTPRKSDKKFVNVYTPPHLRSQTSPIDRSHTSPNIVRDQPKEVTSDSANLSDDDPTSDEIGETFFIGDYFTKGQLGLYDPHLYYKDFKDGFSESQNEWSDPNEVTMAGTEQSVITNGYNLDYSKDNDCDNDELRRASQEINRSNKRLMKQSFHSDVLVISDPVESNNDKLTVEPETQPQEEEIKITKKPKDLQKPKPKLEAKVSLKREENDWDTVFDESGECLDPSLLEELTATVGNVRISKPKHNYEQYQTKGQAMFNGPIDETLAHVIEVYDFPSEFKTNDLLSVFSEYKDTGFEIKWVDDTHALIVFSSAKIAADVLSSARPLVRCRPLHLATPESRSKAKKSAEFLQPYRARPETCLALARRLVSGALGVRLSTAQQERIEEARLIEHARQRKRLAAQQKEAAWEGSLGAEDSADNT